MTKTERAAELHDRADTLQAKGNDLHGRAQQVVQAAMLAAAETGDYTAARQSLEVQASMEAEAKALWLQAREARDAAWSLQNGSARKRQTRKGAGQVAVASVLAGGNGRVASGQNDILD